MLRFDSAGRSHAGLVRADNEDSGFAGPSLVLVADGVGGAAAGEVASATAAYVTSALAHRPTRTPTRSTVLDRAVRLTHEQLRVGTTQDPSRAGMGTTLTALLTDGRAGRALPRRRLAGLPAARRGADPADPGPDLRADCSSTRA